ncbi:MAG: glycosyltransferase family 4 protein, partial [Candidatus Rokuibacteriota bacterium]
MPPPGRGALLGAVPGRRGRARLRDSPRRRGGVGALVKVAVLRRRWTAAGGGERFAHAFVETLAGAGHEVHLFAEHWRTPPPRVRLHRIPSLPAGAAARTLAYAVLAPRAARAAGVDVVHSFERTLAQDLYRAGEGCHRQWLGLRRHLGRRRRWSESWRPFHRVVLALEDRICRRGAARLIVVNSRLVEDGFRGAYG